LLARRGKHLTVRRFFERVAGVFGDASKSGGTLRRRDVQPAIMRGASVPTRNRRPASDGRGLRIKRGGDARGSGAR
jgi:hypothetical protein